MQHSTTDVAEKNLARLLVGFHKMEKCTLFGHLKRNKCKVLTMLRKHKHENQTFEEFIKGNFDFQCFERNSILFRVNVDWIK